jgi:hypothetical protein
VAIGVTIKFGHREPWLRRALRLVESVMFTSVVEDWIWWAASIPE